MGGKVEVGVTRALTQHGTSERHPTLPTRRCNMLIPHYVSVFQPTFTTSNQTIFIEAAESVHSTGFGGHWLMMGAKAVIH